MSTYSESRHSSPSCPGCGATRTARVRRKGLMQTYILSRFGLFPWECRSCHKVFTFKARGGARRRHRANDLGIVRLPPSLNGTPMGQVDF